MSAPPAPSGAAAAAPRYAIYFAPAPDTGLWEFGSAVLGYDAYTGKPVAQMVPPGWSAGDWHEATAEPRRYGFHATLKAPFRLAEGTCEADLVAALRDVGRAHGAVRLIGLEVATIGSFVALVPTGGLDPLNRLAAAVVRTFDRFRAPLTTAERERRSPESLTPPQRDYLDRWGYPFVLDEFRFHMTLTGPLPPERARETRAALADAADLRHGLAPVSVDRIALFREDPQTRRFMVTGHIALPQAGEAEPSSPGAFRG